MKELYFTKDTIDMEAKKFLTALHYLRKKKEVVLRPDASALLVLDMQRYFLEEDSHAYIPSAKAIIPNIKQLQEEFLSRDIKVYQTRHINNEENAVQMKTWWKDSITRDNPYSALIDDLYDKRAETLNKIQYDAFYCTGLERRLVGGGIKQVVITGVMTHLCCESTARSAFVRGCEVFFVVDGTAAYNREFHQASLLNLSHGFATPVLAREIVEALAGKPNES